VHGLDPERMDNVLRWTPSRSRLAVGLGAPVLAAAIILAMASTAPAAPAPGRNAGSETLVLTPYSGQPIDLPVSAYSFDVEQVLNIGSQASGAGAGKITFNPLTVTTAPDANTPAVFQAAATGQAFKAAELVIPTTGGAVETFDFSLVAVKTVAWAGGSAGGGPGDGPGAQASTETIAFEYGALRVSYGQSGQTPQTSFGWNRVNNSSAGA